MYGTVARVRLKPGTESAMLALMDEFIARQVPGFVTHYIYRMDKDPNEFITVVIFTSKEAYFANANSSEQNDMYNRMVQLSAGELEWNDGEIIFPPSAAA